MNRSWRKWSITKTHITHTHTHTHTHTSHTQTHDTCISHTQTHHTHISHTHAHCWGTRVLCCVRAGTCSCTWPPTPGWICLSVAASSSPYRMSGITCRKGFLHVPRAPSDKKDTPLLKPPIVCGARSGDRDRMHQGAAAAVVWRLWLWHNHREGGREWRRERGRRISLAGFGFTIM